MDLRAWRKELRVASASADGAKVAAVLREALPHESLQAAGDALLGVVPWSEDLGALATLTAERLRERGWRGDEELAEALSGGDDALVPLRVDLEELAAVLDATDPQPGLLDLASGAVWPAVAIEDAWSSGFDDGPPEDAELEDGWLSIPADGPGGRELTGFIRTVEDPHLADRLAEAVRGKGAFRRFYAVLDQAPDEHTRWRAFADDRSVGRARAWLAEAGYRTARPRPT